MAWTPNYLGDQEISLMKQTRTAPLVLPGSAAALAAGLSAGALCGWAAPVGTMMAVDRRTTGTQVEDEGIEPRSANRLSELLATVVTSTTSSTARCC